MKENGKPEGEGFDCGMWMEVVDGAATDLVEFLSSVGVEICKREWLSPRAEDGDVDRVSTVCRPQ